MPAPIQISMNNKELESLVRSLVEQYLARETTDRQASEEVLPAPMLKVVTESDVRGAGLGGTVLATANAIVTAAAEDLATAWGVTIKRGSTERKRPQRIAIARSSWLRNERRTAGLSEIAGRNRGAGPWHSQ